jgi:hypothetical protein
MLVERFLNSDRKKDYTEKKSSSFILPGKAKNP